MFLVLCFQLETDIALHHAAVGIPLLSAARCVVTLSDCGMPAAYCTRRCNHTHMHVQRLCNQADTGAYATGVSVVYINRSSGTKVKPRSFTITTTHRDASQPCSALVKGVPTSPTVTLGASTLRSTSSSSSSFWLQLSC